MKNEYKWKVTVEGEPHIVRCNPYKTVFDVYVDDERVEITAIDGVNPSRISSIACEGWERVSRAVASTWKGCIVSPYLMVQCSDSRHYGNISDKVYRFSAMDMTAQERATIHGHNERIRLESIGRAVEFYIRLMQKC